MQFVGHPFPREAILHVLKKQETIISNNEGEFMLLNVFLYLLYPLLIIFRDEKRYIGKY